MTDITKRSKYSGFTLIELLVVIAIIALLLAIVMPALKAVKEQAGAAVCLANQSQLMKSWILYANDNDDTLCNPMPGTKPPSENNGFVGLPVNLAINAVITNVRHTTVDEEIEGIKNGTLFPYYEAHDLMHCPSDKRFAKPPLMPGTDKDGAYRTYSIVHNAGATEDDWPNATEFGKEKYLYQKTSQITAPGDKYIIIEEGDGRGFNMGSWVVDPLTPNKATLIDPIAIFHNDRSTLGFADGHAERYVWQDPDTIDFAAQVIDGRWNKEWYGWTDPQGESSYNPDVQYLKLHYAYNR